ncbi:MAG: fatty acid desaturase [Mycobacterium sp.]|nr:fatty acid desaturase [Mycobacterium sp.]
MASAQSQRAPRAHRRTDRLEPWRDWAALVVWNHGILLIAALTRPSWPWLLLLSLPLGLGLATATLTVLHDAGHKQFSQRSWPNVFATQTAAPVGLWADYWGLKHRVHHKATAVYPLDAATHSSGMVRFHPAAAVWKVHRYQQYYAWVLYGLAWAGELRSQVTYVRTGDISGTEAPPFRARLGSFLLEKAICLVLLTPYALLLGIGHLAVLIVASLTVASVLAAIVLVVGHINTGLVPTTVAPTGASWSTHLLHTTASFSMSSLPMRWITGGMTHHVAHHLRPVAPRSALQGIQDTVVRDLVQRSGVPSVEFPTLTAAVVGHYRRLKALGQQEAPVPVGSDAVTELVGMPAEAGLVTGVFAGVPVPAGRGAAVPAGFSAP